MLKSTSSVHDILAQKPPFGSRFLVDEAQVWDQNAWDHVPPPNDQIEIISQSLARQRIAPVPAQDKVKYNQKPAKHWDDFYKNNSSNFFRNRKWLQLEFPELVSATQPDAGPVTIAEIGCGAGNAIFPILSTNQNPSLSLHAYDYSPHAISLVQSNPLYTCPPHGSINAALWDLSSHNDTLPQGLEPSSVDIVILVFVLSALHPDEWDHALSNIHKMLKPNGVVLFRDYGRHDLTQLRFKTHRLLDENFYIRGDKTRVYFFDINELSLLFTGSCVPITTDRAEVKTAQILTDQGEKPEEEQTISALIPSSSSPPHNPITLPTNTTQIPPANPQSSPTSTIHPNLSTLLTIPQQPSRPPLFTADQLGVDRRLIVNRKRQLKMYRVWMQGKFRKLSS